MITARIPRGKPRREGGASHAVCPRLDPPLSASGGVPGTETGCDATGLAVHGRSVLPPACDCGGAGSGRIGALPMAAPILSMADQDRAAQELAPSHPVRGRIGPIPMSGQGPTYNATIPRLAVDRTMDKVFIEALEIETLIGIYDWERRIRQPLLFDIEMAFDNRRPAATDDIADTLDYKAVSKRLIEYVSQSSFGLVETLAERCAGIILDEFAVSHVRLKLSKPGAVRGARAVGVMIERGKV